VITSLSPSAGAKLKSPKDTVSASASDNQRVAKMSLVIDGKEVATTTGSSISYSWNTRRVSSGAHTITVRAWDAAGNPVSQSATVYK
jgi:thermitase